MRGTTGNGDEVIVRFRDYDLTALVSTPGYDGAVASQRQAVLAPACNTNEVAVRNVSSTLRHPRFAFSEQRARPA